MYYGRILEEDIADGTGIRLALFVSGCERKCPGCFQPETWNFKFGKPFTNETLDTLVEMIDKDYYSGLTILGGEPLNPQNRHQVADIIKAMRQNMRSDQTIWIYSGYYLNDLLKENDADIEYILNNIDTLVDGPFIQEQKDLTLKFRGSANQRIINITHVAGNRIYDFE
jgi:anaerobic ribonucleoside-triphosphate reductase activating protein